MSVVTQNPANYQVEQWTAESEIETFPPLVAWNEFGQLLFSNWAKDEAGNLCNASDMSIWVPVETWFVSVPYWGDTFPGWSSADGMQPFLTGIDLVGDGQQYTLV